MTNNNVIKIQGSTKPRQRQLTLLVDSSRELLFETSLDKILNLVDT